MANYGPPGGPYPGPPPEPWPDPNRQADDEYGQPADPWGDQDQAGGQGQWSGGQPSAPPASPGTPVGYPAAPHPGGGSAPFAAPPAGWAPPAGSDPVWAPPVGDPNWSTSAPEPTPKGRGGRVFVGVIVALALLVVGGAAIGTYLFGRDQATPEAQSTSGPTEDTTEPSTPSTQPAPTSAAPEPSTDARFVKAGQCVSNEGSEAAPKLAITVCAPQTFEVLARYNGATTGATDAKAKCAKVQNYTNFYFFDSELDELDFVLCLRKR